MGTMLATALLSPGPAPGPAWSTVLSTWRSTWPADVAVTAAAALYLRSVLRAGGWPVLRTVSFLAGLVVTVVTVDSGISVYAPASFTVHMVMHLSLIMVVPALVVAGRPLELLRRGMSERGAARLDAAVGGRIARAATFPVTVLVIYAAVVVLTHLTGFPAAVASSPVVHGAEQLLYLVTGLLFFHTALGLDHHPFRPSYAGRFVLMLISMGVDTLVGIVLMMAPSSLLPMFRVDDVHLGGAIMWSIGDGLMMVIMVALSWRWVTDSSSRVDFGPWLESARRSAFEAQVSDDDRRAGADDDRGGRSDGVPATISDDLDADDEALAAYNRMLARLHRGEPPR